MPLRTALALLSPLLPIGAALWLSGFDADTRAYRELGAVLRDEARPGDVLVVSPEWDLDRLRTLQPFGLPVIAAPVPLVVQALGTLGARLWVVHASWQSPPWPAPAPPGWRSERRRIVDLTVDLLQRPPAPPSAPEPPPGALAYAAQARASVSELGSGAGTTPCARRGDRLACGQADWQWVGPTAISVNGSQRRCLALHPIAGKIVEVELPSVLLRGKLSFRTFLPDDAPSKEGQIEVEVLHGGRPLAQLQHSLSRREQQHDIAAPPARADLQVRVSAAEDVIANFCFDFTP